MRSKRKNLNRNLFFAIATLSLGFMGCGSGLLTVGPGFDCTSRYLSSYKMETIAGTTTTSGSSTDPFMMFNPIGAIFEPASSRMVIADSANHVVRVYDFPVNGVGSAFVAGTVAASGSAGDGGPATVANLSTPTGLVRDSSGNLYIADSGNHTIRKVDAQTGNISLLAGGPTVPGTNDGTGAAARFNGPRDLLIINNTYLLVSDSNNHCIRQVNISDGEVTTIIGLCGTSGDSEGDASNSRLNTPMQMVHDGTGTIYFADALNYRIRSYSILTKNMTTYAGNGVNAATDGVGTSASFSEPTGLAIDECNIIYVADKSIDYIRKILPSSVYVSTIAGTGAPAYSDNDDATLASINNVEGLVAGKNGTVLVLDTGNHSIRNLVPR